ncbi:MAG: hypothetical protein KAR21_09700 [Spirochaetales bacterium]|nr:hypothetical protein [Spirochaetales bacterium]
MKKLIMVIVGLSILSAAVFASDSKTMVTGGFGINFFGYNAPYLTTGFLYQVEIKDGMDLVGGVDFGIRTKTNSSGEVEADFLIPLKIGVYFPFPGEKITFGFGSGLSPCFQFTHNDSDAGFLVGPYINGSLRMKVHPVMSVFLQVQQDILFGKPDWIYTGSQIKAGISF